MTGSKLTKKDYTKTTLRAYFLQNGFNYSNYQGLGYALVMYPAFKKLYGDNPAKLAEELDNNCEFYNTNPNFLPFITSIHLAMAENGMEYDEIRGIKMALMGPLLAIKLVMGGYGRRLGTSMIDKLSEKMGVISEAASMIGVTVIAGLAATFVKMNVAITFSAGAIEEGVKQSTVDIQAMLDKVAPALLPVLYTALMYYLIKKKGVTTYWLVLITVVIGVALSCLGILA